MKRNLATRLIASIIRTIMAVIIIAVGVCYIYIAMHWQVWCPNNDLGTLLVIGMHIGSIMVLLYGIYLLSPIYIGTACCILMEKILENTVINYENYEEDDEEDYEWEDFRKKVIRLQDKYLW